MRPLQSEARVIAAAEALAGMLGANPNHSVAAAVMDASGSIHEAVNVHHFTGGPCAEVVALGVAAAAHAGPLLAIAAAGDGGRDLIPPCGRCRQVLLDLHPDIMVAVPGDNGPSMQPIRKLLPWAYRHPDADAIRLVRFNQRYFDAVASGEKTTTIRWDDPIDVGPAVFVFEDHQDNPVLEGEVTSIGRHPLATLTAEQAQLGPDGDLDRLKVGLRGHYPEIPDDALVDVVGFEIRRSE